MIFSKKLLLLFSLVFIISGCEKVGLSQFAKIYQNLNAKKQHIFENISIDRNKALLPIELPCIYSFSVKIPHSILKQYKMLPKSKNSISTNYRGINIPISVDITVYDKDDLIIYQGSQKEFKYNGTTKENNESVHWFSFSLNRLVKQKYYMTTHANIKTDIPFFQDIGFIVEDDRCNNK